MNKTAFSDLENGAIKNGGDAASSKHRSEFVDGQSQPNQRSNDENNSTAMGTTDSKITKRRRSEDFDFFQRNDLTTKDTGKDLFTRVQRSDPVSKDGKPNLIKIIIKKKKKTMII